MLSVAIEKRLREFQLRAAFAAGDELVALFGPSGAGKSVTLRCVAGILRPDAGSIQIDGEWVFDAARGVDLPPQRRRVGYVPQSYALFPHLTVAENVGYGLSRLPAAEARARVAAMLVRLELGGLEGRRPRELSGGQQQRVALARALVTRPRVLLLDEPFAALDAPLRVRLRRDLLHLQRQLRIATLFITHDPGEAYMLGERIAVYDRGVVLQAGPREEVWQRPSSARVARLVGFANVLPATVRRDLPAPADSPALVAVETPRFRLWAAVSPDPLPTRVAVAIRPEAIGVVAAGSAGDEPNRLPVRILDETCTGVYHTLYCQVGSAAARALPDDRQAALVDAPATEPDLEVLVPTKRYVELDLAHTRECTLVVPPAVVRLVAEG